MAALTGCHVPRHPPTPPPLNVLFIAVDDLRPQIHAYGDPLVQTPNIDRLVERGFVLEGDCQEAICNLLLVAAYGPAPGHPAPLRRGGPLSRHPSRRGDLAAVLQGARLFHAVDWKGLPRPHRGIPSRGASPAGRRPSCRAPTSRPPRKKRIAPAGRPSTRPTTPFPTVKRRRPPSTRCARWARGRSFSPSDSPGRTCRSSCRRRISIDIRPKRLVRAQPLAAGGRARDCAAAWSASLGRFDDIPASGKISDDKAREIIRAYDAAVTHIDAQIGRVVDALDALGLRQRTLVVVWGDHGWHLGEHGLWAKDTNFEVAARVPLIVSAPGLPPRRLDELVEFVDIYPTLAELAGLPPPDGVEGSSFAALVRGGPRPWKRAAFTQTRHERFLGRSMRTDRYRYTEWAEDNQPPAGLELAIRSRHRSRRERQPGRSAGRARRC